MDEAAFASFEMVFGEGVRDCAEAEGVLRGLEGGSVEDC